MMTKRRLALTAAVVVATTTFTGCSYENLNSLALPGDKGVGDGSYTVRLQLRNALNLVPNSPVMVSDVNVGTIRSVELDGYQPVATISLDGAVKLPENVTAKIGQTSLLGAKHIELIEPPVGEQKGTLHDGSTIPLSRTGAFPETEDVIASAATLLNGGGLQQIKTITTELNKALGGRVGTTRQLLQRSTQFTASLDSQKTSIVKAIDSMDRISAEFEANNATIDRALTSLPPALKVLAEDRRKLVTTLESLGQFGGSVGAFVDQGGNALVRNVAALAPVMRELADAKKSLTSSLWIVPTVAFPLRTMGDYIRGDYINLWGSVDVGLDTLDRGLLSGTPAAGVLLNPLGFLDNLPGLTQVPGPQTLTPSVPVPNPTGAGTATPVSPTPTPTQNPLATLLTGLLGGGAK
ncbi:MAG: virulence factor Mce family protein [Aeromicrobium sp.]|nr:virulence factor Mce family protein [Aeromicrobium sp.]